MTDSGKSKKFEKITKKGKQKKRAQAASRTVNSSRVDHIPLINPTSALLTHTNQRRNPQPKHVQPQSQSNQSQSQSQPRSTLPPRAPQSQGQSHSTLPPLVPQSQPIPTPAPHSTTPEPTQSQPIPTPAPYSTTPEPTQPQPIPTQVPHTQESPVINQTSASSSSHATGGNNENKIVIVPEGDGFDKHKLVISNIASCIRKKFDEAKPSWKKMSTDQRDTWFDMFQKDFTWLPQYNDMVRRNFEQRGSAKLTQLLQEARKNLDRRPSWIGDSVWARLKQHWQSSEFKKKSETNKRNRDSMAGASLHTGGSIPHHEDDDGDEDGDGDGDGDGDEDGDNVLGDE
ncbi:hypothetical protein RIF29_39240 [Crotalaria pallida]|uniref:Uncharacterized protein n=1 Tax=Crotalaria pallida TaxID=3830 RepID=A0AAN9E1C2_CROPI